MIKLIEEVVMPKRCLSTCTYFADFLSFSVNVEKQMTGWFPIFLFLFVTSNAKCKSSSTSLKCSLIRKQKMVDLFCHPHFKMKLEQL